MTITIKPAKKLPSEEQVAELERLLATILPSTYRNFLLRKGAGKPESNLLKVGDDQQINVRSFLGLTNEHEDGLMYVRREYLGRVSPEFLIIARDDSGNLICIRLSGSEMGSVYFWDHEEEILQERDAMKSNMYKIADDFSLFLEKLMPFNADEVDLNPEDIKETWIKPGFRPRFE